ncbi:MAG: hypothetical protein OSB70_06635 [Myxococcota bacterium]|nr:hypothetical protein [Myxococcota bacterium]
MIDVLKSLLCLVLVSLSPGLASAQVDWESAPRFVEADQAYMERAEPGRIEFANQRYEELYRSNPEDWEAAWRVAMSCYFLGSRVAKEKSEKEAFFARGRDVALQGIELNPSCAPCQLLAGVNMALYAESVGLVKMLFSLGGMRKHLRLSLELDPTFAEGAAARSLATIDQVVPFFLGGSKKRARENYQLALEIDPAEPLNYLYYARFLEKRRELKAALALTRRGLAQPQPGPERVESRGAFEELQSLESRLEKKLEEGSRPLRPVKPGQRKKR